MVGADTAGFNRNTDEELANRWHGLSAFTYVAVRSPFPRPPADRAELLFNPAFYPLLTVSQQYRPLFRNHNTKTALSQEPYRWDSVAESARIAIKARYHLLPYWLSLFADAANYGTPVIRALFYEFDDPTYAEVDEQFMVGDSLLVSPVLRPNATSVEAYLPYHGNTKWRNWFTHEEIAGAKDKVTLDAPLSTIPVYIRSGSALLIHRDTGYTLTETRESPFSLLVYLDVNNYADGCTKIDDGISYPGESERGNVVLV